MNPSSPQFYYLEGDPNTNPTAGGKTVIPFIEFAVESVVDGGAVHIRMYSRESKGTRIFSSGVEGPLPSFEACAVDGMSTRLRIHADIPFTLRQARTVWNAYVRQGWRVPPHVQNGSVLYDTLPKTERVQGSVPPGTTLTPAAVEKVKTALAAIDSGMKYALHA